MSQNLPRLKSSKPDNNGTAFSRDELLALHSDYLTWNNFENDEHDKFDMSITPIHGMNICFIFIISTALLPHRAKMANSTTMPNAYLWVLKVNLSTIL